MMEFNQIELRVKKVWEGRDSARYGWYIAFWFDPHAGGPSEYMSLPADEQSTFFGAWKSAIAFAEILKAHNKF